MTMVRLARALFGSAGVSPTMQQRVYVVVKQIFDLLDKGIPPAAVIAEPLEESHVLYKSCFRQSSKGGGFASTRDGADIRNSADSLLQLFAAIELYRSGLFQLASVDTHVRQWRRNALKENKILLEFKVSTTFIVYTVYLYIRSQCMQVITHFTVECILYAHAEPVLHALSVVKALSCS
jgi:hypothetical protein